MRDSAIFNGDPSRRPQDLYILGMRVDREDSGWEHGLNITPARVSKPIVFGYYDGENLIYAGPDSQRVHSIVSGPAIQTAEASVCGAVGSAARLPSPRGQERTVGERLTAAKMKECGWVAPVLAGLERLFHTD
jgi:hypothetical protein